MLVESNKFVSIPSMEEVFTRFDGSRYFGILDLRSSFYQLSLDEKSKDITAFQVGQRKFRLNKLAMGLHCSPYFLSLVVNEAMRGLEDHVLVYVDDITIHASSEAEFIRMLAAVFT